MLPTFHQLTKKGEEWQWAEKNKGHLKNSTPIMSTLSLVQPNQDVCLDWRPMPQAMPLGQSSPKLVMMQMASGRL